MAEIVRRPHLQNFIDWSADKPEVGVNAITNVSGANDAEPDARM